MKKHHDEMYDFDKAMEADEAADVVEDRYAMIFEIRCHQAEQGKRLITPEQTKKLSDKQLAKKLAKLEASAEFYYGGAE